MIKIDNAPNPKKINNINENKKKEADVFEFSKNVINELSVNNIPSIPINYSIYFEKLLDGKDSEIKQKFNDLIETAELVHSSQDNHIRIEKEIKQSFVQIKSMLQAVMLIYKNLNVMKGIIGKKKNDLDHNISLLALQNILNSFSNDLTKLDLLMTKHLDVIKVNYEEISKVFKNVEEQAIYDNLFDVYNKKYFLNTMQSELDCVQRYGYSSSFLMLKVKDEVLSKITNLKEKNKILKEVSSLLLKTSRRSDVVAHYGGGCFAMVMKHTDISSAKKACERILNIIKSMNSIKDDDFKIIACPINKDDNIEVLLSKSLDMLSDDNSLNLVCIGEN